MTNKIVSALLAVMLMLSLGGCSGEVKKETYESKLFDTSKVHEVDVRIADWDSFVANAAEEEYVNGSIVIDGETFDNVAIRTKGNSSLKTAIKAGEGRFSLKIEFDHYDEEKTYYGLDKLHLNNIAFDATYMKDYSAYYLMRSMGVPSSLCSYTFVTVNGEDLGLYIALEGIEESYLERNFGSDYDGNLLKPDDKHNQPEETSSSTQTSTNADKSKKKSKESSSDVELTVEEQFDRLDKSLKSANTWLEEGVIELASLNYVGDDVDSYEVLFNSEVTKFKKKEKKNLIEAIRKLNERNDLENAVDTNEVINYMATQCFLVNYDGYLGARAHNFYLYVEKSGRMTMLPWDYNQSAGGYGSLSSLVAVNLPIDTPYGTDISKRPLFQFIAESEEYKNKYYEALSNLCEKEVDSGKLLNELDRIHDLIVTYVDRDPTKSVTVEQFEEGYKELKKFWGLRSESIKLQVSGVMPTTVDGMKAEPEKLLDVGDLDIGKTKSSSGK